MAGAGYFCVSRSIFEHAIAKDHERFFAWMDIVGNCTRGVESGGLKRGQFQASERALAQRWGWATSAVHRFLEYLKSESMIEIAVSPKSVQDSPVYAVVNYEKYNGTIKQKSSKNPIEAPTEAPTGAPTGAASEALKSQNPLPFIGNAEAPTEAPTGAPTGAASEALSYKEEEGFKKDSLRAAEKTAAPVTPKIDSAFEVFREAFAAYYDGIPYRPARDKKTGDFVQLAELRNVLGVPARESPPGWHRAVANYFATSQGSHTLSDLCTRFAVFHKSRLDRFLQPSAERKPSVHDFL